MEQLKSKLRETTEDAGRKSLETQISLLKITLSGCPSTGVEIVYNYDADLTLSYERGNFITAFFRADRPSHDIISASGVEAVNLSSSIGIDESPARDIIRYMVHLKTQQSFAKNENDMQSEQYVKEWFDRFEKALRILLDDDSITLKYDYKNYNFVFQQKDRIPSGLNGLSDGYS